MKREALRREVRDYPQGSHDDLVDARIDLIHARINLSHSSRSARIRLLGWLLITCGIALFVVGAWSVAGPWLADRQAHLESLPTATPTPLCREVVLSDGKIAIACIGGGYGTFSLAPPTAMPFPTDDDDAASSSWDWSSGSDSSWDTGGWDTGGYDGGWDTGGYDGGWDSGSWDSGSGDAGSWDSGGSDSGSW